jgi:hypothetical protein
MAQKICADSKLLTYSTPEARGRLLFHLSNPDVGGNSELRANAIIKILETIQSKKEWQKTTMWIVPAPGHWLLNTTTSANQVGAAQMQVGEALVVTSFGQRYYDWHTHLPDTETHLRENVSKPPEQVNRWRQS